MRLERRLTAARVASIAIAGSLLLYAGLWQAMLPYHGHIGHAHGFGSFLWAARWMIARFVLPLAVGAWMMYGALEAFRRGIDYEIWSVVSVGKLRTQIDRSVWTVAAYTMTLTSLGYIIFYLVSQNHGASRLGGFTYFFTSPLICLMQLRKAMRPKRERVPQVWPGDTKPLVSAHWGERTVSKDILG
jgi:hypothetical protein